MDCSPRGSSVHGILQARILEWVALPSSRGLPNPGTEPTSLALQAGSPPLVPSGKPTQLESHSSNTVSLGLTSFISLSPSIRRQAPLEQRLVCLHLMCPRASHSAHVCGRDGFMNEAMM